MGPGELLRRDAEVEGPRVGDLQVIVVHGHGAARDRVVAVADGVGDGLAGGAGRVPGLVFAHHLARDHPSGNGYVVHQKGFGPPQE